MASKESTFKTALEKVATPVQEPQRPARICIFERIDEKRLLRFEQSYKEQIKSTAKVFWKVVNELKDSQEQQDKVLNDISQKNTSLSSV